MCRRRCCWCLQCQSRLPDRAAAGGRRGTAALATAATLRTETRSCVRCRRGAAGVAAAAAAAERVAIGKRAGAVEGAARCADCRRSAGLPAAPACSFCSGVEACCTAPLYCTWKPAIPGPCLHLQFTAAAPVHGFAAGVWGPGRQRSKRADTRAGRCRLEGRRSAGGRRGGAADAEPLMLAYDALHPHAADGLACWCSLQTLVCPLAACCCRSLAALAPLLRSLLRLPGAGASWVDAVPHRGRGGVLPQLQDAGDDVSC